jgi:predicted DNA-binding protein
MPITAKAQPEPDEHISIRLPRTERERLDLYARENDLTRSQVIRAAIRAYLNSKEGQ